MFLMILGLILFAGLHLIMSITRDDPQGPRAQLVKRFGATGYRYAYVVAAVLGFGIIIWGWRDASSSSLWDLQTWMRVVTIVLMLPAFAMILAGFGMSKPIQARLKHPMLMGVALLSFAHFISSPELRNMILFAGLGAWAALHAYLLIRKEEEVEAAGAVKLRKNPKLKKMTRAEQQMNNLCLALALGIWLVMIALHSIIFGVGVWS